MSISSSGNWPPSGLYRLPGRLTPIPEEDENEVKTTPNTHHNNTNLISEQHHAKEEKPSPKHPGGGLNYVW